MYMHVSMYVSTYMYLMSFVFVFVFVVGMVVLSRVVIVMDPQNLPSLNMYMERNRSKTRGLMSGR